MKYNAERWNSESEVERYEKMVDEGLFPEEQEIVQEHFSTGDRILDIGCGVGRTTHRLDELGYDVVGVDISEPSIKRAQSLFPDVEFQVGDALELSFSEESFDHILFSYNGFDCIHPEPDRHRALKELRRVLDPNGVLAFSSRNSWYRFPSLLFDHNYISKFYVENGNFQNIFDRFKIREMDEVTFKMYISNPLLQRRQLRRCGFELVSTIGKRDGVSRYFEAMLYYVARKH